MKVNRSAWQWLSGILMVAGLGWVGYLLVTTIDDPRKFIPDSIAWLIIATFLVALSLAANIELFYIFINSKSGADYPFRLVARLSVTGQLLRYLPGRLWGLVYQISTARQLIPAVQITRANIDFMVFALFGNSIIAVLLIGNHKAWDNWLLIALGISGIFFLGGLFLGGANWLIRVFASYLPNRWRQLISNLTETQPNLYQMILIFAVFISSWILYLAGWNLLGLVFHDFSSVDFTLLCAFYTVASIIGIISALTPAGLGVREAVFFFLAMNSTTPEVIAFFAIFGRVWLMLVEIFLLIAVMLYFLFIKETRQ